MSDAANGILSNISAAATGTAIGSYTEAWRFVSESVKKQGRHIDTSGFVGTRSRQSERVADDGYSVGGQVVFHATPLLLDVWLPRILGAVASGTTFALAESLPEFDLLVNRGGTKRFQYGNCKVNRATFRGQPGQALLLTLDILGKTEVVSATAFPTLTAPVDTPYSFAQLVGTLVATTRIIKDVEITIDNQLEARQSNSLTVTSIMPAGRSITVKATTPFTSAETDLYGQALLGSGGTMVWTNGGCSLTFTFAALQAPDESPVVSGPGEIDLVQTYVARKSSTTSELVVVNDSTA